MDTKKTSIVDHWRFRQWNIANVQAVRRSITGAEPAKAIQL